MAAAGVAATGRIVLAADLCGTALFALQGAAVAGGAGLDWLGILVVAFVAALGGGMLRDVLLGAVPPVALCRGTYALVVCAAWFAVLLTRGGGWPSARPLLIGLDAAGLALFAVAGTEKALDAGCRGFAAILLGAVTATGGGVLRDVLLARVPAILRVDFYATAALAGAAILVLSRRAGADPRAAAAVGGLACLGLRLAGAWAGWRLPHMR